MFRNLLIGAAVIGLCVGGSFVAGLTVGQRTAPPRAPAAPQPAPNVQFGGPGGADSAAGGGSAVVAVTAGTISRVDGNTVYVKGPDGRETRVALTDQTRIQKQADGTVADLQPGAQVAVRAQGPSASDGTVTAGTVSLLP